MVRPLADPRCNAAHDPATALAIRGRRARSTAVGPRSRELTRGTGTRRAATRRRARHLAERTEVAKKMVKEMKEDTGERHDV
jgi:hypothetical protein